MSCFYPSQSPKTKDLEVWVRFAETACCTGQVRKRLESSLHLLYFLFFFFFPLLLQLPLNSCSLGALVRWKRRDEGIEGGKKEGEKARRELLLSKINKSIKKSTEVLLKKKKKSQSQHTHSISTNRIVMCLPLICAASPYALPCAHVMSF